MDEDKTLRKPSSDAARTIRKPSGKNDDADKTIRKPSEVPADTDKTMRKPSVDTEKTLRKDSQDTVRETAGTDTDKTIAVGKKPDDVSGVTAKEGTSEVYELNGKKYNFKKIISESTGEGQIYLLERDGNVYVLKLYYPQFNPKAELLEILKSFDFPGIIKLFEYGVWTSAQGSKRSFELMEFLEGGTLDEVFFVKDAAKLKDLALQASNALAFCHNNRIIHKDIKPGNFFFREKQHKQLVLGDFGIASLCAEDELMHQTQQARTPIYAAPELYETIDDKVEIDGKVDFYSLGILLMYIWLGGNPFRDNERRMLRMKRNGELPYPKDAPSDVLSLMQGLTIVDPAKRWGYDEVQRWHKGEAVAVAKNTAARYKPFVFDADLNLIANNPLELAKLLDKNPQLAIKYLYSKRVTRWLEECGNNKLAVEVEDLLEKRYPKNQEAGLRATVYLLDESAVYHSVDGSVCDNFEKMAQALVKNRGHYAKALKDSDDEFYIYLQALGNNKERDLFVGYFKKLEPEVALWKTIYYLDETTPFYLETLSGKNKKGYDLCKTSNDVIVNFREKDITDDGWNSFIDGRFLAWYSTQNDPDTYKRIEKIIDNEDLTTTVTVHAMLYYLNPEVSFNLYLPGENEDQYYFTKSETGNLFNHYACRKYQEKEKTDFIDECLENLDNEKSLIHWYFKSKGWKKEDEWVKYCFDLKSDDNRKKCGPYNQEIALYKAIKGLGYDPYYHFAGSDKSVYSLEELKDIPKDEIIKEMEKSCLKSWLAVFYQEDPYAELQTQYAYENLTKQYVEKIKELNSDCKEATRFDEATAILGNLKKKVKNHYGRLKTMKIALGTVLLIPALALLGLLIIYKIPLSDNPLPGGFWKVSFIYWLLASVLLGIYTWRANRDGGIVTNLLAGLFEAIILYYIVYFIVALLYPVVTIISIIAVIAGAAAILWLAFGGRSSTRGLREELLSDSDPATTLVEPLYHAFHHGKGGFKSSKSDALETFNTELSRQDKKLLSWILPGIATFILLFAAFLYFHPKVSGNPSTQESAETAVPAMTDQQKALVAGTWKGKFDNRPSTFIIQPFTTDVILGNMSIKTRKMVKANITGAINFKEKTMEFTGTVDNVRLDGKFTASISSGLDTITGSYLNLKTNKVTNFQYVKPAGEPKK